jgi:tRNA nucleotidyltransferase (CCA-adding enzyme)
MDFLKLARQNRPVRAMEKVKPILDSINAEIKKKEITAQAMIGGSVAKETSLKYFDCDIFVMFDKKYKDKDLSELLEIILSNYPKKQRVHGSRDYFKIFLKGIEFEIIPVLKINSAEEALNVTDVSPLHVHWVQKHIGHLADDIRLAKMFCKAQGVYGAESYINGFSGYMVEILVIHYGGFMELLKGVSKWRPKKVIDHSKYYHDANEVFQKMNAAKLESPLILIDPVQKNRNAASALGHETFAKIIVVAKEFLAKPSIKFFQATPFSLAKVKKDAKKYGAELVLVEAVLHDGKRDIIGSKIVKAHEHIKDELGRNEFSILDSGWNWDSKALLWYIVYPKELPKHKKHLGPMVYSDDKDVMKFIDKHKTYQVENYRIFSLVNRKHRSPKALITAILKEDYFTDKFKKKKVV